MEPSRNIKATTMDSMSQKSDEIFLPVLLDIQHASIEWNYDESAVDSFKQQNGHLRLVSDVRGVMYKGSDQSAHYYEPCSFSVKLPKEDGKEKAKANLNFNYMGDSVIEAIREVGENISCRIVGLYAKSTDSNGKVKYSFSKLYGKTFEMTNVTWDGVTAQWDLDPDTIQDLNVPKDKADSFKMLSLAE